MFWVWLVIIQLVIFTALVFFLRMLLTRNVSSATAHLHELNQDYNEKVEAANKKKEEVDRYYNEMLLKAKADAEKQKVLILREAQTTQEAVVKDARRQGEDIIGQANKAQEMALAQIENQVEERALLRSGELILKVLTEEMSAHLHELWVKELLKTGFDDLEKLHLPEGVGEVTIQSAFPLSADQRTAFSKKLRTALSKDLSLKEEVVPSMVAGIRIALGSLVIDGSLQFKVKEASRDVKPA